MSFRGTKMPNLGEETAITVSGRDDAHAAYYVYLDDILLGLVLMAFDHPRHLHDFLVLYFKTPNQRQVKMILRAEIVSKLAQIRNRRIMAKLNELMAGKQGVELFPLDKPGYEPLDIDAVIADAEALGVSTAKYLDETNDPDDVAGCSNAFNLVQNTEPGKAADKIQLLSDLNGNFWVLVIERVFAPGKGCVAFPGGFLNIGETFVAASLREADEEVSNSVCLTSGVFMIVKPHIVLEEKLRTLWDPRLKFPHGMIVGGTVEVVRCVNDLASFAAFFGYYPEVFAGMTPEDVCEFLKIDTVSASGKSVIAAYRAFTA
jgi:hypothetical protein